MKSELAEDVSFILFLLPLIITGGYLLFASSIASGYDTDIYLSITRDPIIFMISILAVSVGTLVEIYSNPLSLREKKLEINARRMQWLAGITFLTSGVAAWVSLGGSATLPAFFGLFLTARFPLIYSVLLAVLSSVLTLQFKIPSTESSLVVNSTSVIILLLAPVSFLLGTTAQLPFALVVTVSVALLAVGIGLFAQANKTWFGTEKPL
jgi:hypothetical protein